MFLLSFFFNFFSVFFFCPLLRALFYPPPPARLFCPFLICPWLARLSSFAVTCPPIGFLFGFFVCVGMSVCLLVRFVFCRWCKVSALDIFLFLSSPLARFFSSLFSFFPFYSLFSFLFTFLFYSLFFLFSFLFLSLFPPYFFPSRSSPPTLFFFYTLAALPGVALWFIWMIGLSVCLVDRFPPAFGPFRLGSWILTWLVPALANVRALLRLSCSFLTTRRWRGDWCGWLDIYPCYFFKIGSNPK